MAHRKVITEFGIYLGRTVHPCHQYHPWIHSIRPIEQPRDLFIMRLIISASWTPVREEFDYGEGGRSVSEDRIEIGDVQIDGVVAKISVARFDGAEERTRSRRRRRSR